jgi:hypothetical protein
MNWKIVLRWLGVRRNRRHWSFLFIARDTFRGHSSGEILFLNAQLRDWRDADLCEIRNPAGIDELDWKEAMSSLSKQGHEMAAG